MDPNSQKDDVSGSSGMRSTTVSNDSHLQRDASVGEPPPICEFSSDTMTGMQSHDVNKAELSSSSVEKTTVDFIGGRSPRIFKKGLIVRSPSKYLTCDIAEAPLKLRISERVKPLEGSFVISFKEESVDHVRCHSLSLSQEQDLQQMLDLYEEIEHTVAVILINPSPGDMLDPAIHIHVKNELINIPVYTMSCVDGEKIQDLVRSSKRNECVCYFVFDQGASDNLPNNLKKFLFAGSTTVNEDPAIFKFLTDAFLDKSLTDDHLDEAMKALSKHMYRIYSGEFIFLINLIHTLMNNERYKERKDVHDLRKDIIHYMIQLKREQISGPVQAFWRKSLDVLKEDRDCPFFHNLHTAMLRIVNEQDFKISDLKIDFVMKWTSVALKFKCQKRSCTVNPKAVWKKSVTELLQGTTLTEKVMTRVAEGIKCGGEIELPLEDTYIGCGSIEALLQKNEFFRTFAELRNIIKYLHEWVRRPDEYQKWFCHLPLNTHKVALDDLSKQNQHVNEYSKIAAESPHDVIEEGCQYLSCLTTYYPEDYNSEALESDLKDWLKHLLKLFNIKEDGSVRIIKSVLTSSEGLFAQKSGAFLKVFIQQLQLKGRENLESLSLGHFVTLSIQCQLWDADIVSEYFAKCKNRLKEISPNVHNALKHFSKCHGGASAHKFLVEHLLRPLADSYAIRNEAKYFLLELLNFDGKELLAISNDDDKEVVQEFFNYLKGYVSQIELSQHIKKIKESLKVINPFKQIVLDVIAQKLCKFDIHTCSGHDVVMLTVTTEELNQLMIEEDNFIQYPLKFCWNIVGEVCKKLILLDISFNQKQCNFLEILGSIDVDRAQKCMKASNPDHIHDYLTLVSFVKGKLEAFQRKITKRNVTFDEIKELELTTDLRNSICDAFGFRDRVQEVTLSTMRNDFMRNHERISSLLIQSDKIHWSSFNEVLPAYNIEIPHEFLQEILSSFEFPNGKKLMSSATQGLATSSIAGRRFLGVKKGVTLSNLECLVSQAEKLFGPLLPLMPMLEHFHFNKSKLFMALVKNHLQDNEKTTADALAKILRNVKETMQKLLTGTITYNEFRIKGDVISHFHLVKNEFETMTSFEDFNQYSSSDAITHFESIIILFLVTNHIDSLYKFCEEFELHQCLNGNLGELRKIVQENQLWKEKEIKTITEVVKKIQGFLYISSSNCTIASFEFLRLFKPLWNDTKELRAFLKDNNFIGKGQTRFLQLLSLLTQEFQHVECYTEILTKLYAVYYHLLLPLSKSDLSFQELTETVSKLESSTCLAQLKTVKSNIDLIKRWLSRAEKDTVANTLADLQSITANGMFRITVHSGCYDEDDLMLIFQLDQDEKNSSSVPTDAAPQSTRWNASEIRDFIRRLGFALDSKDERMKSFMNLFEMVKKLQTLMRSLNEMGHPDYCGPSKQLKCSAKKDNLEEIQKSVKEMESLEKNWSEQACANRSKYRWLCFFKNDSIINLYELLKSEDILNVFNHLCFLFPNYRSMCNKDDILKDIVPVLKSCSFNMPPMHVVGEFLMKLLEGPSCRFTSLKIDLPSSHHSYKFLSHAILHQCHKHNSKQLIQYLYSINGCIPKAFETLRCTSQTTQTDLHLFFQRMRDFPRHYFILKVNCLSSKLQEELLHQYLNVYEILTTHGTLSTIHLIETSTSILHDAPYITTAVSRVSQLTNDHRIQINDDMELVYGLQGNGKTHYIKSQLTTNSIVLAINEAFSESDVIRRLKSLLEKSNCSLHINFTLFPPGTNVAKEERHDFNQLISRIGWFMFDLFVLGYVQDRNSGLSFSAASVDKLKVFIEVPSITSDPNKTLSSFKDLLPVFFFIGTKKLIDSDVPFVIDDDVQLVCKYLKALEEEKIKPEWGINKLFYGCDPIKFGCGKNLDSQQCISLLNEYMPEYVKRHKISQKLFVKYMKRRCQFLDNFPGYNFNQGTGYKESEDTRQLGSTLMNAMLKEVCHFCDPSTKTDWSQQVQTHQQLIYETQEGGGSIGLICCNYELSLDEFKKIGVDIPSIEDLRERSVLDEYLSRALSLPLKAVTEVFQNGTRYKRLQMIDDNKYVMTLDFALKMININERKECGMPVIIEGETGVGKTELVKMLSKLWNYSWEVQWAEQKQKLNQLLETLQQKRQIEGDMPLHHRLAALEESFAYDVDSLTGATNEDDVLDKEELKCFILQLKQNPLFSILQCKTPIDLGSSHFDTKSSFEFLNAVSTADVSTFHKLDIHAGLKPSDIVTFFNGVVEQAKRIKTVYSSSVTPQVVVYLDEVNTSSCMGLFKEIIVDGTIDGKPLEDNIFIVAACNPLRGDSTAWLRHVKNVWHKPKYYVRELHPTIEYLKWDFGALTDIQEKEYVKAKLKQIEDEAARNVDPVQLLKGFYSTEINYLIVESQTKIRTFADETLTRAGFSKSYAKICSRSCVSQRDMQRVFDFYKWLCATYKEFQRFDNNQKEQKMRATLVSLGLVYYLRLGEKDRKRYADFLNDECRRLGIVKFTEAFADELDWYIDKINLQTGIAKTKALKENVFATVACCQTHTPLIIIGEPGTSKTLSFNLVSNTFEVNNEGLQFFKSLQPFFYQCSKHTNSIEIQKLLNHAAERQNVYNSSNVPTYCVVFMDEAGLPEERHESLKVLHYHLDARQVSFVAITNHALDAAKTNRAVSLYRPETPTDDLQILAEELLCPAMPIQPSDKKHISLLCSSFSKLMSNEEKCFRTFYGQRDFMHFLSYLKRRRGTGFGILNLDIVLEALERNLNGHEYFPEVFDCFLKEFGKTYSEMRTAHRSILDIVHNSLIDLSVYISSEEEQPDQFFIENSVRYKLIIDNSEDDSAPRYLMACGMLDRSKVYMFSCGDFPEESGMNISTIAGIINSAEKGHTIFMFQTDKIHESFYELFNQRMRIMADPEKGVRLFTNISIGAHTKPCRVHPEFQCVVVVKKSELHSTPPAFLNRFEKFSFSYSTLYMSILESMPPNFRIIIDTVFNKVASFVNKLNQSKSFYGYTPQLQDGAWVTELNSISSRDSSILESDHSTLCSLLLSLLPNFEAKYTVGNCEIEKKQMAGSNDKYLEILITVLNALQSKAGWNIPQVSVIELKSECNAIFQLLLKDAHFNDAIENEQFDFQGAVGEAMDAIYNKEVKVMHDDSCLVLAVIVQWLVRYVTRKLTHTLTPEALVVNAEHIPKPLMRVYFEDQEHFSLHKMIRHFLEKMNSPSFWNLKPYISKVLVYTRHSHLFSSFPSIFPSETATAIDEEFLKEIVHENLHSLKVFKVSSDTIEGEIDKSISEFINHSSQNVFVIIANMQDVTIKMINHLRILIEQRESFSKLMNKLIIILLQFSQVQFFNRCYPVLYLSGWDHFYLDSLTTDINAQSIPKPLRNVVDIRQCFRIALCIDSTDEALALNLRPLVEEAILVISSRVNIGTSGEHFNRVMSIIDRQNKLRELLLVRGEEVVSPTIVGEAICSVFHHYWDNSSVARFLKDAAQFTFHNKSTLSITSYIRTRIKALFFEFIVYSLHKINEDCNLDNYFSSNSTYVRKFFAEVVEKNMLHLPDLATLSSVCTNLVQPEDRGFKFPFFGTMCHCLEELLNCSQETINCGNIPDKELEEVLFNEMKTQVKQALQNEEKYQVLGPMISFLVKTPDARALYLRDFIHFKCIVGSQISTTSTMKCLPNETFRQVYSPVVYTYFEFNPLDKNQDPVEFLAKVHVRTEVHKADLTHVINKLQKLERFAVQYQLDTNSLAKSNFGSVVIQISYDSLDNIINHWSEEQSEIAKKLDDLKHWYDSYRDIVQVDSLYNSLCEVECDFKLQFLKAHMMYLLINSFECLTPENLEFAIAFYSAHIKMIHLSDDAKVENALSEYFSALCETKSITSLSVILDKLLAFILHFPIDESFCKWFFKATLPDSALPLLNYLSPDQYKHYLLILLKANERHSTEGSHNILRIFRSDVRTLIGQIIFEDPRLHLNSQQCVDVFLTERMPMCTLATIYTMAVYQELHDSVTSSVIAISQLQDFFVKGEDLTDCAEKQLLSLEQEALMQRLLQLVASDMNQRTGSQNLTLGRLPEEINALLDKEKMQDERGDLLCMHLWSEVKGVERLRRTLTVHAACKLNCLQKHRESFEKVIQAPDFPPIIPIDSTLAKLYRETCSLMERIHKKTCEPNQLQIFAEALCDGDKISAVFHFGEFEILKGNAFCMCVWLCSYYQYYKNNETSEVLGSTIHNQMEGYFSDNVIRLITSFLNKNLIEKHLEQKPSDNSSNPLFGNGSGDSPTLTSTKIQKDPLYELFFSEEKTEAHLCDALAIMVAAILACPDEATHLWYHLFDPNELVGTYITGFLFDSQIEEEMPYNCGIVLNEEGNYGRPQYLPRIEKGILTLHSLYLLLLFNFGSFCMNLLIQRGPTPRKHPVISTKAIRYYSKFQLSSMWQHMKTNLILTDEQLSLLTVHSMQRMMQVCYQEPKSALLQSQDERDEYERMWLKQIFIPSLAYVKSQFGEDQCHNEKVMQLKKMHAQFPHIPTLNRFTHFVRERCCSMETTAKYDVLLTFINYYSYLETGGTLLPSLIEFYQWIVTNLSGVITKKQATEMSVSAAVDLIIQRYSKELKDYYLKLFRDMAANYNEYLKMIDFTFSSSMFFFLPGERTNTDEKKRLGYLLFVIKDIAMHHNHFLHKMKDLISAQPCLRKYMLDDDLPVVHPAAVNEHSCIVGKHNSTVFLQLVRKHRTDGATFDLDKLQEEVVEHFIAGKLAIDDCEARLHKAFHYKLEEPHQPRKRLENPTKLILKLHPADGISEKFKAEIPKRSDFLMALEHELFSLDYDSLVEVAQGLQRITEHVKKKLEEHELAEEEIIDSEVKDVLPKLVHRSYSHDSEVKPKLVHRSYSHDSICGQAFEDLGVTKLLCGRISAIPMKYLFTTFKKVVEWTEMGIYDFYTLPKAMKMPLDEKDYENLEKTCKQGRCLQKLENIVEILMKHEQYFIDHIDSIKENDIFDCLSKMDPPILISDEESKLFPKPIKTENYVALRIFLRRTINDLNEKRGSTVTASTKWFEHVEDLWTENKLLHLREVAGPMTYDQVLDPVTELYGFQVDAIDDDKDVFDNDNEEFHDDSEISDSSTPQNDQAKDPLKRFARKLTTEDIADYLRSLKLDQYIETFSDYEVDGEIMFDIEDKDLQDFGISSGKDRLKIRKKFKNWVEDKANTN